MARKAKDDAAKPAKSNGFDPELARSLRSRILDLKAEMIQEKASCAGRCKGLLDDIKDVFTEAKARGIPVKEFKAAIKMAELIGRAEAVRDSLESEQQETLDQIRHALGDLADTPLGRAASGEANGASDDERDLRPAFLREKNAAEAEKLKAGIKQLPN